MLSQWKSCASAHRTGHRDLLASREGQAGHRTGIRRRADRWRFPDSLRTSRSGAQRHRLQGRRIDTLLTAHAQNSRVERMRPFSTGSSFTSRCTDVTASDTPAKVVVDEALELTRAFTGDEAVGFVDGIWTRRGSIWAASSAGVGPCGSAGSDPFWAVDPGPDTGSTERVRRSAGQRRANSMSSSELGVDLYPPPSIALTRSTTS